MPALEGLTESHRKQHSGSLMLKTRDQAGTEQAACSLRAGARDIAVQPARLRDHTPWGKRPRAHLHRVSSKAESQLAGSAMNQGKGFGLGRSQFTAEM